MVLTASRNGVEQGSGKEQPVQHPREVRVFHRQGEFGDAKRMLRDWKSLEQEYLRLTDRKCIAAPKARFSGGVIRCSCLDTMPDLSTST